VVYFPRELVTNFPIRSAIQRAYNSGQSVKQRYYDSLSEVTADSERPQAAVRRVFSLTMAFLGRTVAAAMWKASS
jgi:hypothetical protein